MAFDAQCTVKRITLFLGIESPRRQSGADFEPIHLAKIYEIYGVHAKSQILWGTFDAQCTVKRITFLCLGGKTAVLGFRHPDFQALVLMIRHT